MAEKNDSMLGSQKAFIVVGILFLIGVLYCGYLLVSTKITQRLIVADQRHIDQQQQINQAFFDIPGFDKLQVVKNLEEYNYQMPWSDHIQKITEIFDELTSVDNANANNIRLSDFQISLDQISLRGYVTNLKLLYGGNDATNDPNQVALIEKFEQLDFLSEISIKTYEKSAGGIGYEFVLTAKVINNYEK